jgi:hypothetical protein
MTLLNGLINISQPSLWAFKYSADGQASLYGPPPVTPVQVDPAPLYGPGPASSGPLGIIGSWLYNWPENIVHSPFKSGAIYLPIVIILVVVGLFIVIFHHRKKKRYVANHTKDSDNRPTTGV